MRWAWVSGCIFAVGRAGGKSEPSTMRKMTLVVGGALLVKATVAKHDGRTLTC